MPRDLRFEQRMSEREALMWALEQDPVLRSAFANVTFLDRPPDLGRLRARMIRACTTVPRLRQRIEEPTGGLSAPTWVDDPLFDIDHHLRRIGVPPPGGEREVLDLAATLSGDAFDRARPLWQFIVVEGLADGRGAMVQRLHHTFADGEASVRLSGTFIDVERDATEPLVSGDEQPFGGAAGDRAGSSGESVRAAVTGAVRFPFDAARWAVNHVGTDPREAPARAGELVETARSLLRQLAVTEPARSPLWTDRSLRRHLEVLSIPLDRTKAAAAVLGGTVNDVFVAGAAGAAGAYHRAHGVDIDELRMAMPVSTRTSDESGSNAFTPLRMVVPTGADPRERFHQLRAVLQATKGERASSLATQLAGLVNVLPTPVIAKVVRQQVSTVDFATSNIRGAPFDLYVAGAKVLGNHPIGPMTGTAFMLTTMSCSGRLDMGCVVDPAAVAEPALLRACLVEAFDEIFAVAGV